jgi:hypothetical protein
MAGVTGVTRDSDCEGLKLQTGLKGGIGAKSFSGALTNPEPPPENANAPGQRGAAVAQKIKNVQTTGIVLAMFDHSRLLSGRVGP